MSRIARAPSIPAGAPPAVGVLRALADPTRQRLLRLLLENELTVSDLVVVLQQPQSTVSRHLRILREAGLVTDRRDGTASCYRAIADRAGHAAPNGEASEGDLSPILLGWLKDRPLDAPLRHRLDRLLAAQNVSEVGFFERLGQRWDQMRAAAFGRTFAIESLVHVLPGGWTVADVGAGTGALLPVLSRVFRRVIAVEPAAAMLECARRRAADVGAHNVAFHQGDLSCLPIRTGTCDLVIACLVLHHVPEPAVALTEINRVLRPGGQVLIVEQHRHDLQEFQETMQDRRTGFETRLLAKDVSEAGFEDIALRDLATAGPEGPAPSPRLFVIKAVRSPGIDSRRNNGRHRRRAGARRKDRSATRPSEDHA